MSRYGDAEDNAAMLARFPAGFAILEASWTRVHNGPSPRLTLHRTRGTIAYDGDKIGIWREKGAESSEQS